MGPYLGDYKEDGTLCFCWDTNDADGASITRATDGTIKVYKDDNTTESVVGIVDSEDFDGITGVHNCKIDLGSDAFYAIGHDYSVVLVGAVIDGETVNSVLAEFSIENRNCDNKVDIVTAMLAMVGITEGGTWTYEKAMKIMTAFMAGNWRVKASDSTKQELMDAEDGTTVILEQSITRSPSVGSKYRDITVKI